MRHAKTAPIFLLFMAVAVGLVAPGCGKKRVSEEDLGQAIRAKVHSVAIALPYSGTTLVEQEQVEAAFLGRTSDRLEAAGLRVVGAEVWEEIWRRYAGDVGGVYDASTGEVDDEKYRTVQDATDRELVEVHHADAILYLEVRLVTTWGVRSPPRVCGGSVVPYWPGGWVRTGHGASLVRTACLVAFLYDPSRNEYFGRQAPIEGMETYDRLTRAQRPADAIFKNEMALDQATAIVLKPLLATASPEPGLEQSSAASSKAAPEKASDEEPAESRPAVDEPLEDGGD